MVLAALIYLRWADFQEAEQEAIAAFDEVDYSPVLPASLHFRSWHDSSPDELVRLFSDRLPQALEGLNNSRGNPLATSLHRIAPAISHLGLLSPPSLSGLIRWLAEQPFETPSDRRTLLDVFDAVLWNFLDKFSGEFRTPRTIARLLVEIGAPSSGDRVYDPCFGSAGLLTAALGHVLRKEKDHLSRTGIPHLEISGVERDSETYLIGLTRLALAGVADPQLELGSSLEGIPPSNLQREGFDLVLANPPWGMRVDPAGLDHFPVRTTDATGLFIQHALSMLRPQGRAVIVVPQGILFRGGSEQRLRRMLLEQHTVEAVVALPETAFMPYTAVKSSILVLRSGGPTKRIRMVDADPYFEKGKGRQPASISTEQAEQLVKELRAPEPGKHSWDVDVPSLAEVEWDFTPRRRDQSGLFKVLDSLSLGVDVLPLGECCTVLAGKAIKSTDLVDDPVGEDPIPYVRIKDVHRGQATKGSSWLSANAAAFVDARWKLRTGDVLLSKSGTIGKAGVARNGAVGAIAASGLFVLRPDQDRLDPHFLVAYFKSFECRMWLDDHSHAGATIKHLSKSVLEKLPVPLPPLQMQQRIAAEHRNRDIDGLVLLSQLLTEGEKDPIAEWVNSMLDLLPSSASPTDDPLDLSLVHRIAIESQSLRITLAHGSRADNRLGKWALAFVGAMSTLRDVDGVPKGPALFGILQSANSRISEASRDIGGKLPDVARARALTDYVSETLAGASEFLLKDVVLIITPQIDSVKVGQDIGIGLDVQHKGALPLREVRFHTAIGWGMSGLKYLAENSSESITLSVTAPKTPGEITFWIDWYAQALDGSDISGQTEISLNVVESKTEKPVYEFELGGSPYVCGDPVRPERKDVFFGREDLLEQIRRQISKSGNVVLLEGNRRAGKTSILWHLEDPNAVPGWMGIYCSLQGAEGGREVMGVPTVEVFREMAKSIASSLHRLGGETPLPDGSVMPPDKRLGFAKACREGISDASPFSDFRAYAEVALERLAEHGLGLLLMLDEFDKLQEGIESGVTSPQVLENIRFMVQTYPRFSAILTGLRRLKRLRQEYWSALYGLGTRFGVTSLPEEPARRLVTEPVKGRLTYSGEAVDRAIYLTAGQPYLLQCLCNRVFDMAAQLKIRSVTLDLVDQASKALIEDNEHFANLWDYAVSDRRRFILTLCHRAADSPDPFRLGVIQEQLLSHGIEVDDETLIADLEFLRELELIDLVGGFSGGHYKLTIPLMGTWIEKEQDFNALMSKARSETEDQHG
ncbi:MAG: N-6 DNA methylase [Thermodesulfobacteriota bacterium]